MTARDEIEDRIIDRALHELHGEMPPDLVGSVLARLERTAPPGPLPDVSPRRPLRWWWAAAAVVFGVSVGAAWPRDAAPEVGLELDCAMLTGALHCRDRLGSEHRIDQGRTRTIELAPGSRLEFESPPAGGAAPQLSTLAIGPFGLLVAASSTELEVVGMEISRRGGVIAAGALTLGVASGVATWYVLGRVEQASAGESIRLETGAEADQRAALQRELAELKQRYADQQQRLDTLANQLARTPAPAVPGSQVPAKEDPAVAVPATPDTVIASLTFDDAAFGEALRKIDWTSVGAVSAEMGPKLVELLKALDVEGAEMPMDVAVAVQRLNQKLLEQLPALIAAKLPGIGPNGVFTHPLVVANSLAAMLSAGGKGLTAAQQGSIDALVRGFANENAALAGQTHDFDLEALAAETEMKERMYQQLSQSLTQEQQMLMYPQGANAFDGSSLFSTGLQWTVHNEGIATSGAPDFARAASRKLEAHLGLDDATAAKVRDVLERAAAGAPELFAARATPVENATAGRHAQSGRAKAALTRQLAWMREIQRTVPLTAEQKKKLASWRRILVPLPR